MQRRARRYSLLEFPFQILFLNAVQGTALVALALWLGADAVEISILSSFPFLGNVVAVFGPYALERLGTKRRLTMGAFGLSATMYGLLPVIAALGDAFPESRPILRIALVPAVAVGEMARAMANVSYLAWIADVFEPSVRARFFSARFSVMASANVLAGLAIGVYLNMWGLGSRIDPIAFYTLIPVAMLAMAVAISFMSRIPGGDTADLPTATMGVRGHLAPFRDPLYKGFLAARSLQAVAFQLLGPFTTVFLIVDLALPYSIVFMLQVIYQVMAVLGYRVWEPMTARVGARKMFIMSAAVFSVFPFIFPWSGVLGLWLLVPLHLLFGFWEGGFMLAVQLLTMNLAPEKRQVAYIGTANSVTGLLWGVSSIVGGLLVAPLSRIPLVGALSPVGSGLPALMLLCAALRVAIIPSLLWIKDIPVRGAPEKD